MKIRQPPIAKNVYVIIRGNRSEHHNAPFEPFIVCSRKHTAMWEARHTGDKLGCGSTVFVNLCPSEGGSWRMVRYRGYEIETCSHLDTLFDGKDQRIENHIINFSSCVWWSYDKMPEWVKVLGVRFPDDDFTKQRILDDSGLCLLPYAKSEKIRRSIYDRPIPDWLVKSDKK